MAAHELDHDLQGPQDAIPRAERRGWRFLSYAPAKIDNIWVPVEGVCRRERPPVDSEDAQPQSLRHELFEKRITEQREYQDSVTAIRKKYAEGADPNAKDIEVRHTDIWSLTDEEEARVRRRYPHGPLAKREFDDKR